MRFALLAASAATATIVAVSTALPAVARDGAQKPIEAIVPAFAQPQTASDVVPERVDLVALGGIASDSTRFLGSDGYAEYWVGRGNAGNVCLIMAVKGEAQVVASSCATITNFYRQGIGLVAGADPKEPATSAEAYLLPADITSDDLGLGMQARSSAQATHDSLISLRPGSNEGVRTIERHDGSSFRFAPVSAALGDR